jgi:T5orf172 domain
MLRVTHGRGWIMVVKGKGLGPEDMVRAGVVYAFRYGDGDHAKIGKTSNLKQRSKSLQVAHHNPLVLAELIEHDDYKEGEKYIHKLLADRRVQRSGNGAREHFFVSDAELTEAFAQTRKYLDNELPREREVEKYQALQAGDNVLPATDEDLEIKHRLQELRAARARVLPELNRLDNELKQVEERQAPKRELIRRELTELAAAEDRLMTSIKLAIGPAAGIDGVASWLSVANRRRFDEESLRVAEPSLFEAYSTKFDQSRFRQDHPATYEAHMLATTSRKFRWVDDDDTVSDADASGDPSPRWRRLATRTTRRHTRLHNGSRTGPPLISTAPARPLDGA